MDKGKTDSRGPTYISKFGDDEKDVDEMKH